MLGEELAHGILDQLDADDLVPSSGQECEVLGLAAQRHQDAATAHEPVAMFDQERVGLALVKADPAFLPARVPERMIHVASVADLAGRVARSNMRAMQFRSRSMTPGV